MNIRTLNQTQIKALINKPNFMEIYQTLDKDSQRLLKPYVKNKKSPNIVKKVSNLATATAKWQKHGRPMVTSDVYEKRLKICKGCEFWKNTSYAPTAVGECKVCGCPSYKLYWGTESCPLKVPKWPATVK